MKTIHSNYLVLSVILLLATRMYSQTGIPISNFSASAVFVCVGDPVQFTDLSQNNPTSWKWTFQGGSPTTSTQQHPVASYKFPGKYDVILKATNEHGSEMIGKLSMVTVQVCSAISETNEESELTIFPNPASSYLSVSAKIDLPYTLYNALGSVILKGNLMKDEVNTVKVESLPAGIYFFSIQQGSRNRSYKIVKE